MGGEEAGAEGYGGDSGHVRSDQHETAAEAEPRGDQQPQFAVGTFSPYGG